MNLNEFGKEVFKSAKRTLKEEMQEPRQELQSMLNSVLDTLTIRMGILLGSLITVLFLFYGLIYGLEEWFRVSKALTSFCIAAAVAVGLLLIPKQNINLRRGNENSKDISH